MAEPRKIRKVLFVRSSHYADDGRLVRARRFLDRLTIKNLAEMGLPLLAAYTPSHIAVEYVDDCINDLSFDSDADVVAVSGMLIHHKRAVDIAREFRKRGKVVVMGGFLATFRPDLVENDVDSLCIGEGDLIWPQMLKDIETGCLKPRYKADFSTPLDRVPVPRYDLIRRDGFLSLSSSYPVQATRGCPYQCEYCSIMTFYEQTYRLRPVADVIRDIRATRSRQIHFVDDNLMENRKYAKELFTAMKGLGVTWGTQTTMNIARDPELLRLAYEAGCRVVMLGMESFNQSNLDGVSKAWSRANDFKQDVQRIQDAGIAVHALIVFGLPEDRPGVFESTVKMLEEIGVVAVEFFIFTPYPATPVGKRYLQEGRIFDLDVTHYREPNVVFWHDHLTPQQLQDGYWEAYRGFYSLPKILRRFAQTRFRHRFFQLALNLYYWLKIKRRIVPTHFQRGNYSFSVFPERPRTS